jgi:hypothetical protein
MSGDYVTFEPYTERKQCYDTGFTFHNIVHVCIYPNLTIFYVLLDKSIIYNIVHLNTLELSVLSQLTRYVDVGGCHGGVKPHFWFGRQL